MRYYQAWIEEEIHDPLSQFSNNKSQLPSVAKKFSSDDGTAHFRDDFEWSDEELDAMEKDKDEIEAEFNSPPGYQIWNFHMSTCDLVILTYGL